LLLPRCARRPGSPLFPYATLFRSRLLARETLVSLAATLRRRDGLLIVDEAFIDLYPANASLATDLPPATIVLRSFGKVYGLAGRSEEHTSELQSREKLVCRLLLEK